MTLARLTMATTLLSCAPRASLDAPPRTIPEALAARDPPAREVARTFGTHDRAGAFGSWWSRPVDILPRDSARRFLLDGVAVEVMSDGRSRAGVGSFDTRDTLPLRRDGGWRFVSSATVWDADDFTATPRFVAHARRGRLGRGAGRVVEIVDGHAEGATFPPGVVIDAAFSDDHRGVALMEPGVVISTDDGGAAWAVASGLPPRVEDVIADHSRRWVTSASGSFALDGVAAARVSPVEVPSRADTSETAPDVASLAATRITAWRALSFTDHRRRDVLLWSAWRDRSERLAEYDLVEGRFVSAVRPPEDCRVARYFGADRLYAECERGASTVLYARGADGAWTSRLAARRCGAAPRCFVSSSGGRVACVGLCAATRECPVGLAVCERDATRGERQREVGALNEPWETVGYEGESLVFIERRRYARRARVIRGDGAALPLTTSPEAERWVIEEVAPRVGRDGRLRLVVRDVGAERGRIVEGRVGERFDARPSPPWSAGDGARSERLCSPEGDSVVLAPDSTPWVSTAAQREWHPFVSREGDAYLRQFPFSRVLGSVAGPPCDEVSWTWGLTVVGWGEPTLAPEFSVPHESDAAPQASWITCEPSAFVASTTAREGEVPPWAITGGRLRVRRGPNAGASAFTYAAPTLGDDGSAALLDTTSGRASLLSLSPEGVFTRWTLSPRAPPIVASRATALQFPWTAPRWVVARDGASVAALVAPSEGDDSAPPVLWTSTSPRATRVDALIVLRSAPGWIGAYALDGDVGVLRLLADGTALAARARALPRVISRATELAPCGPAARGDFVLRATLSDGVTDASDDEPHTRDAVLRLRLDGDALCVRALTTNGDGEDPSRPLYARLPPTRCALHREGD